MKNSLDFLISPYTRERFFQDYFEQRHLHIKADDPERFNHILSAATLEHIVSSQKLTLPNTRMAHKDSDLDANQLTLEGTNIIDLNRVIEKYSEGATLILSQLQDRVETLKSLCNTLTADFGQRFQTNIYCTPGNSSQGFTIHHDTHDVFILQIEGSKDWKIYESPIELAIKDQGFKQELHQPGAVIDEFTMNPGDLLYIPRGLMHAAKTSNKRSIHITTGFMGFTWQDFMIDKINKLSQEHLDLRRGFQPDFWNNPQQHEAVYKRILGILGQPQELQSGLNHLYQHSLNRFRVSTLNPIAQAEAIHHLNLDTNLVVEENSMSFVEQISDTELSITLYNKEITLPATLMPVIDFIIESKSFQLKELPLLDDAGKINLAQTLLKAGMLRSKMSRQERATEVLNGFATSL